MGASFHAGRVNAMAPDFTRSKSAAARIFHLLDRQPVINNISEDEGQPQVR